MIALLLAIAAAPPAPPIPAVAVASPGAAMPVDPARLAAARRLVEAALPPGQREAMMRGMGEATAANMSRGFEQVPAFAGKFAANPAAKALMLDFVRAQTKLAMDDAIAALPRLTDAMARAYARRFDAGQMDEITAFYSTPTGRALIGQMGTLMTDPDIAAVQRDMSATSLARMQAAMPEMLRQLATVGAASGK